MILVGEAAAWLAAGFLSRDPRFDFTRISGRHEEMQRGLEELLAAQGSALVELDSELGWVYRPDYRGEKYSSNSLGARGGREYAAERPPNRLRIAAFGDSFTHGNEVEDHEAWSARLEAMDEAIEVLNFGVGGYGTDQALMLHERRRGDLEADLVVLGFAEPDYARNLNRFRRFLSVHELPLFKPRFRLSTRQELEFVPNPMPGVSDLRKLIDEPWGVLAAADHDWFFEPMEWCNPLYDYSMLVRVFSTLVSGAWRSALRPDALYRGGQMNPDSEAMAVQVALVRRFAEVVEDDGRHFVFVIFPNRDSDIWTTDPPSYWPMLERLSGMEILDLGPAIEASERITPANLRSGVHYSPIANCIVATAFHRLLVDQGLVESRRFSSLCSDEVCSRSSTGTLPAR